METTTDTKNTIKQFDRTNSQLQNTLFQHSHYHYLCTFTSNEQEPACHTLQSAPAETTLCFTAAVTAITRKRFPMHTHLSSAQTDWRKEAPNVDYAEGVVRQPSQDWQCAPESKRGGVRGRLSSSLAWLYKFKPWTHWSQHSAPCTILW